MCSDKYNKTPAPNALASFERKFKFISYIIFYFCSFLKLNNWKKIQKMDGNVGMNRKIDPCLPPPQKKLVKIWQARLTRCRNLDLVLWSRFLRTNKKQKNKTKQMVRDNTCAKYENNSTRSPSSGRKQDQLFGQTIVNRHTKNNAIETRTCTKPAVRLLQGIRNSSR